MGRARAMLVFVRPLCQPTLFVLPLRCIPRSSERRHVLPGPVRSIGLPIAVVSFASLSLIGEDLDFDVLLARQPRTQWVLVLMTSGSVMAAVLAVMPPELRGTGFLALIVAVLGPFFVHRQLEHPPAGPRTAGGALSATQWVTLLVFATQLGATSGERVPSVSCHVLPDLPAVAMHACYSTRPGRSCRVRAALHGQTDVVMLPMTIFGVTPQRPTNSLTNLDAASAGSR